MPPPQYVKNFIVINISWKYSIKSVLSQVKIITFPKEIIVQFKRIRTANRVKVYKKHPVP